MQRQIEELEGGVVADGHRLKLFRGTWPSGQNAELRAMIRTAAQFGTQGRVRVALAARGRS
jgi:hypothetical protein